MFPFQKALTAVKSAMRLRRLSSIGGFAAGRALLAKAAAKEAEENKEAEEGKDEKKEEKVEGNRERLPLDDKLTDECFDDVLHECNDNQMHVVDDGQCSIHHVDSIADCDLVDRVQCVTNTHVATNDRLCKQLDQSDVLHGDVNDRETEVGLWPSEGKFEQEHLGCSSGICDRPVQPASHIEHVLSPELTLVPSDFLKRVHTCMCSSQTDNVSKMSHISNGTITGFVYERIEDVGKGNCDDEGFEDDVTVAKTTLMSYFTEVVPNLDLEAVPNGRAEEELEQKLKEENSPPGDVTFANGPTSTNHNGTSNGEASNSELEEHGGKPPSSPQSPSPDMNGNRPMVRKRSSKLSSSLKMSLKAINEDKELSVEKPEYLPVFDKNEDPPDYDEEFSPVDRPPLSKRWSNLSTDSIDLTYDDEEDEAESLAFASRDPDVMAADSSRGAQSGRNRRTGFAFNVGDTTIPSNAFCKTQSNDPKMLTVTEMMMRLHMPHAKELQMHRKLSSPELTLPKSLDLPSDKTEDHRRLSSILDRSHTVDSSSLLTPNLSKLAKFSLVGLREQHSEEVKNELDFLDCPGDPKLNLSPFHRALLLRFNPVIRFLLGLLFGLVLGLVIRYRLNPDFV